LDVILNCLGLGEHGVVLFRHHCRVTLLLGFLQLFTLLFLAVSLGVPLCGIVGLLLFLFLVITEYFFTILSICLLSLVFLLLVELFF
jgi:hypothetical protein